MQQDTNSNSKVDSENHFKNETSLKRNISLLMLFVVLMTSCGIIPHSAERLNKLSIGMTKQQVIQVMGKPNSTSMQGGVEDMIYNLYESKNALYDKTAKTKRYYVRLVNDSIESFGKVGDFDNRKNPTININTDGAQSSKDSNSDKMYDELTKLKELYDKGIITKQEYEGKKKEILGKY